MGPNVLLAAAAAPSDAGRAGLTLMVLALVAGMLGLLFVVVLLTTLARRKPFSSPSKEDAAQMPDAWREAGRRMRADPPAAPDGGSRDGS